MNSTSEANPTFSKRIAGLTGSVARHILSCTQNKSIISFAGGLPAPEMWDGLELPTIDSSSYQYGPSEGESTLREIFSQRLQGLGIDAAPSQVLITAGSQQGLDLVSKLFIDPDSPIALEAPTYLAALQCFHLFQARIHSIAIQEDGIDLDALDRTIAANKPRFIYLNPSFQNPSGTCYSLEKRRAIAEILDRHHTVLIEDDPYREICYNGTAPLPIASLLKSAPWIYLSSVSKTLLPSLRIGSLACSQNLFPHLLKLKQASDLHTSRITQSMAGQLLTQERENPQRLETGLRAYKAKRDALALSLEQHLSQLADWSLPQGGMFFWLKLNKRIDLFKALESGIDAGIAFMPGDSFFDDRENNGLFIRLNFTNPSVGDIQRGIPILRDCLEAP